MDIKETINIISYAIKQYKSDDLKMRFSLLEYYSITDIPPFELSKIAFRSKMNSQGQAIYNFADSNFWNQKDVDIPEKLRCFHSFNGKELTNDDKLTIIDKINEEGYPLIDGIYNRTAFCYANNYNFAKESIREKVLNDYYNKNSRIGQKQTEAKVLKKTLDN